MSNDFCAAVPPNRISPTGTQRPDRAVSGSLWFHAFPGICSQSEKKV